jgi:predicted RNA methylase
LAPLRDLPADAEFVDLLPYILDPHSPGTRRSVMRNPDDALARLTRKSSGVYYTPGDVAEFMTSTALGSVPQKPNLRIIDPACGTGIFLRCALRGLRNSTGLDPIDLVDQIYGIDVSVLAVEQAAFILTLECLLAPTVGVLPLTIWRRVRLNLACGDALSLDPPREELLPAWSSTGIAHRIAARAHLRVDDGQRNREAPQPETTAPPDRATLGDLFPEAADGFDVVIANPPYAPLGRRSDFALLRRRFKSLAHSAVGPASNAYIPFVELMWRLANVNGVSSMVVPLSIAYASNTNSVVALREGMVAAGGTWHCAFFDRTPDALFGDDVKQRTAILRRSAGPEERFLVTRLQRWTSRTRAQLFSSIAYVEIPPELIREGIPKLGSEAQAQAFLHLRAAGQSLRSEVVRIQRVAVLTTVDDPLTIYVAGTAYNWLSVFPTAALARHETAKAADTPLTCLTMATSDDALAVYALLSSRLAYWLWRVLADGFHVSGAFLAGLPLTLGRSTTRAALATLGRRLAQEVVDYRVVSVNGGKTSITYCPFACADTVNELDRVLIDAAALPRSFAEELKQLVHENMVVDTTDPSRNSPGSRPLAALAKGIRN